MKTIDQELKEAREEANSAISAEYLAAYSAEDSEQCDPNELNLQIEDIIEVLS